ncbi:MAG: hypothetical protein KGL35_27400, partial [Bradyrhizobium sp.]|nr:hypothetical protein [Bradyrhizobium sp.]
MIARKFAPPLSVPLARTPDVALRLPREKDDDDPIDGAMTVPPEVTFPDVITDPAVSPPDVETDEDDEIDAAVRVPTFQWSGIGPPVPWTPNARCDISVRIKTPISCGSHPGATFTPS